MFGVCFGAPYEFRFNGVAIDEELRPWKPEYIAGAIQQDDCYVEMTFLKALEDHGLDITYEQAGRAFANTEYPLWHANYYGRENVRAGIMPPMSGHPLYNRHADDIDFQIEADLFGILCPGLAGESNRLCDVFGRIMNYGDGLYGGDVRGGDVRGKRISKMRDVRAVLQAGKLDCIPPESLYRQCIEDVIAWQTTWRLATGARHGSASRKNGRTMSIACRELRLTLTRNSTAAYIAMGLLYGKGDLLRTAEIATRCGQDADCNPSNATGVLGCMKGFSAMGAEFTAGIDAIRDEKFIHTDYGFDTLIEACQTVTEQIIARSGGRIEGDVYHILRQPAAPPLTLEQWVHQEELLRTVITPVEMRLWNPAWRVAACGFEMDPGVRTGQDGVEKMLVLHPVSPEEPAAIEAAIDVPAGAKALVATVASDNRGDFLLRVLVNGQLAHESLIDTKGKWQEVAVDLTPYAGKTVQVRVENAANDWRFEAASIASIAVR